MLTVNANVRWRIITQFQIENLVRVHVKNVKSVQKCVFSYEKIITCQFIHVFINSENIHRILKKHNVLILQNINREDFFQKSLNSFDHFDRLRFVSLLFGLEFTKKIQICSLTSLRHHALTSQIFERSLH